MRLYATDVSLSSSTDSYEKTRWMSDASSQLNWTVRLELFYLLNILKYWYTLKAWALLRRLLWSMWDRSEFCVFTEHLLVQTATFQMLVVALVQLRLDYGNAMLVGIPAYLVRRFQLVLNAAARLIYHLRPHDHIFDALATLHWLHVPELVQYKIAVIQSASRQHATISGTSCLPSLICPVGELCGQQVPTSRLVVPPIKLSTVGSRAFPVDAAQVWNSLPEAVISSSSLQTFCHQLKTHFFQLSYSHLIFDHLTGIIRVVLVALFVI